MSRLQSGAIGGLKLLVQAMALPSSNPMADLAKDIDFEDLTGPRARTRDITREHRCSNVVVDNQCGEYDPYAVLCYNDRSERCSRRGPAGTDRRRLLQFERANYKKVPCNRAKRRAPQVHTLHDSHEHTNPVAADAAAIQGEEEEEEKFEDALEEANFSDKMGASDNNVDGEDFSTPRASTRDITRECRYHSGSCQSMVSTASSDAQADNRSTELFTNAGTSESCQSTVSMAFSDAQADNRSKELFTNAGTSEDRAKLDSTESKTESQKTEECSPTTIA